MGALPRLSKTQREPGLACEQGSGSVVGVTVQSGAPGLPGHAIVSPSPAGPAGTSIVIETSQVPSSGGFKGSPRPSSPLASVMLNQGNSEQNMMRTLLLYCVDTLTRATRVSVLTSRNDPWQASRSYSAPLDMTRKSSGPLTIVTSGSHIGSGALLTFPTSS